MFRPYLLARTIVSLLYISTIILWRPLPCEPAHPKTFKATYICACVNPLTYVNICYQSSINVQLQRYYQLQSFPMLASLFCNYCQAINNWKVTIFTFISHAYHSVHNTFFKLYISNAFTISCLIYSITTSEASLVFTEAWPKVLFSSLAQTSTTLTFLPSSGNHLSIQNPFRPQEPGGICVFRHILLIRIFVC